MSETAVCRFCTDALCGTPAGGTCNEAAMAQRIAELEAENERFVQRIANVENARKLQTQRASQLNAEAERLRDVNATLTAQFGAAREVAAYAWHSVNCDFRHCAFTADGDKCDEERAGHFAPHSHEFAPGECSCGLSEAEATLATLGTAQDGAEGGGG